jgi:hypothetical protein
MTRLLLALCFAAAPAMAQEGVTLGNGWQQPTTITLQDTDHPEAVAEVVFRNEPVNGAHHNGDYTLRHGDLTVIVTFTWDMAGNDDGIEVQPPSGFMAVPPILAVPEGATGTVLIFIDEGMVTG